MTSTNRPADAEAIADALARIISELATEPEPFEGCPLGDPGCPDDHGMTSEPFELDAADRRELDGGSWARALRNANASRQRQYARDKLAAAESGTADRALDARIATFVPDTHHLDGRTIPPHLWPAVLYPALGAYWSHALAGGEAIRYALGHPGELIDDYTDGVRIRRNGGRYPYVEGPPFPGQKLTD